MKSEIERMVVRLSRKVPALLAAILLMCPASTSVLCIAPGCHVAIEDLNAPCCGSSDVSTPGDYKTGDRLELESDCSNCTDLFISLNELSPIPKSYDVAASALAAECFGDRLPEIAYSSRSAQNSHLDFFESTPGSSSAPLRC